MEREARRHARGFTLIELLIVVIIIGSLAAIAIPVYLSQRTKAKEAAVKEDVHTIQVGVLSYAIDDNGLYPATEYVTYAPSDKSADNLGNKYLDAWPLNPWTGQPMANTGSSVLFNTNFASMAGLTARVGGTGTWNIVGGQLVAPTDKSGQATGGTALFGSTNWTDTQLQVSAQLNSGPGLGIFFRSDGMPAVNASNGTTNPLGIDAGYCFQVDPGLGNKFVVRKWVNGVESAPLATASMSSSFIATMNSQPHAYNVSAVGSHIVVTVDGASVLDFTDSAYAAGGAGLRAWYGSNVSFISAQAQGSGGAAGSGNPAMGDFAYAYSPSATTYGLVGWMSGGSAWVVQPLL